MTIIQTIGQSCFTNILSELLSAYVIQQKRKILILPSYYIINQNYSYAIRQIHF